MPHAIVRRTAGVLARSATRHASLAAAAPPRLVLAIETSCDDTAAAVVGSDGAVLSSVVRAQHSLHEGYGGIVPRIASRNHSAQLPGVIAEALSRAGVGVADVHAVAATRGPGLAGSLSVGLNAGKAIAAAAGKPFVGVHHMEAHLLTARLTEGAEAVRFPYLCLLVSGGHSMLVLARGLCDYCRLGETLDDSVGEAFDKVARDLGLGWSVDGRPAQPGAALEACARAGDAARFRLPLPLRRKDGLEGPSCNFSFSGLKTAVRNALLAELKGGAELGAVHAADAQLASDMAAAFQTAAIRHLEERTRRALQWCRDAQWGAAPSCLVVSGGVAGNSALRARLAALAAEDGLQLYAPPPSLCGDQAVMIAHAALERLEGGRLRDEQDSLELTIRPKWPLGVAVTH